MSLLNCEINLILTCLDCFISSATGEIKFTITDTKLNVATLSTQDSAELLQELRSCFKQKLSEINTIYSNNILSKHLSW